ncbi:MAG: hypothetical protein R3E62_08600 [Pseudomonadales bacterium]|jgi:hypothetical protein
MKISQAIAQFKAGKLEQIEVRRNPSDNQQWFVMVIKVDGKSLMLADENDQPLVAEDLEKLFSELRKIGFRDARIFF